MGSLGEGGVPDVPLHDVVLEGGGDEDILCGGVPLDVVHVAYVGKGVPSCPLSCMMFLYGALAS